MKVPLKKNRLTIHTDKHLCTFLLSPFREAGLRAYKNHYNLSFPETYKQISNRLEYLKKVYNSNFLHFAEICHSLDISSTLSDPSDEDFSAKPPSPPKAKKSTPTQKTSYQLKPSKIAMDSNFILGKAIEQAVRKHKVCLNFEQPSLNQNGMMWFRDDDVELSDDSMCSFLTIYQPLFDARDQELINLRCDVNDPSILYHYHPTVPTFLYKNYDKVHALEDKEINPDLYDQTRKKHKKQAFKIADSNHLRLQMSEYQLPFSLAFENFDIFQNRSEDGEIMKNYRYFHVDVDQGIRFTCSFVYWKIKIAGETTFCADVPASVKKSAYGDAQSRMSKAFKNLNVTDTDQMSDIHDNRDDAVTVD